MRSDGTSADAIRVILIDDEEVDNFLHTEVVKRSGLGQVDKVFDLAEPALAWLKTQPDNADIILVDVNMPAMNGFEFLEAYAGLDQTYRAGRLVVLLTSSPREEDRSAAEALGASFATKPLSRDVLAALVEQLRGQRARLPLAVDEIA